MTAGADPSAMGSVTVVPPPVAGTTAPVASTAAPVVGTTAPVVGTAVPGAGTTATLAATTAPVAATKVAVVGTVPPVAAEKLEVSEVVNESKPTIAAMVLSAIRELKGKNGSSLQAIKKYLAVNYKIDSAKLAPFIGRFLRRSVVNRTLVRTKGSGALGRFKLPDIEQEMVEAVVVKKKKKRVKTAAGVPKKK